MNTPSHPAPTVGQPEAPKPIPLNVLVEKYRQLRDEKKVIADRHKLELEPYNTALEQISARLFAAMDVAGLNSIKTEEGTAFKSTTVTYSIEDAETFRQWVEANGASDAYENRPSKSFLENYAANTGTLPPGIKVSSHTTINVRK